MTDDESFIRAIVGSPGDDTPRLVYADWLDDRDDPRGAYLRAEMHAIVTCDVATLRELAVGLDPVWVARVSLPPIGVCLEDFDIRDVGPPITSGDVTAAETRLGVAFPAAYRAFLLNYNGCRIRRVWGLVNGETVFDDNEYALHPLLLAPESAGRSLGDEVVQHRVYVDAPSNYWGLEIDSRIRHDFLRFIPIGLCDWDSVLLGIRPPYVGLVRIFPGESRLSPYFLEPQYQPTRPLSEFLARVLWRPGPALGTPPVPPSLQPLPQPRPVDDVPF